MGTRMRLSLTGVLVRVTHIISPMVHAINAIEVEAAAFHDLPLVRQIAVQGGVENVSTADEWLEFFHDFKKSLSQSKTVDPANVYEQICNISQEAVEISSQQLRNGDAYGRTRKKYAAISIIPLVGVSAGRNQTDSFEQVILAALGICDKEYLAQVQHNFHDYFHSNTALAIGLAGSVAGGALRFAAGLNPLGLEMSKGLSPVAGAYKITKQMREMIEIAAQKASVVHEAIFIPLVMVGSLQNALGKGHDNTYQ